MQRAIGRTGFRLKRCQEGIGQRPTGELGEAPGIRPGGESNQSRPPNRQQSSWRAARRETSDLTECKTQDALYRLDPLREHLFPAEQARIVRSLVERVVVGPAGADIRLRLDGLGGLGRDLTAISPGALRAAA